MKLSKHQQEVVEAMRRGAFIRTYQFGTDTLFDEPSGSPIQSLRRSTVVNLVASGLVTRPDALGFIRLKKEDI